MVAAAGRLTLAVAAVMPGRIADCDELTIASVDGPAATPEASAAREAEPNMRSPAAAETRQPAHERTVSNAVCKDGSIEVGVAPDGASWQLPLAAADALFSAQEVQPLGRSAEGSTEAPTLAPTLVVASRPRACRSYVAVTPPKLCEPLSITHSLMAAA